MNDSLIKDIGRSYIVSSLLPASFFVLLAVFIFRNFLPPFNDIISQNSGKPQEPTIVLSSGILVLAFAMWVAFMLYSSVDFVVKLFGGYPYPVFIKVPLQYLQYLLQQKRLKAYFDYQAQMQIIQKDGPDSENGEKALQEKDKLEEEAKKQVRKHEIYGPLYDDWKMFLPTTLGNILAASELYPGEKYKIHGTMLFPRMSLTFPPEFVSAFEEKNNQLMFILNSSLLSFLTGFVALLLGLIQRINFSTWPTFWGEIYKNYLEAGYKNTPANYYVLLGCFFLIMGYGIYRISINAVVEYALFVRSSFDLYRFKVLREFNQPIPTTLEAEQETWKKLSDFLVEGHRFGQVDFEYQLKPEFEAPKPKKKSQD